MITQGSSGRAGSGPRQSAWAGGACRRAGQGTGAPAPALGSRSTRHCSLCYWIESSKNTCEVSGVADVGGVAGMALRVLVWLKRRETRTCWQQPQR